MTTILLSVKPSGTLVSEPLHSANITGKRSVLWDTIVIKGCFPNCQQAPIYETLGTWFSWHVQTRTVLHPHEEISSLCLILKKLGKLGKTN